MRRRKLEYQPQASNRWIVTYTDLAILLMTFFVLLAGMSSRDRNRIRKAMGSMDGTFGLQRDLFDAGSAGRKNAGRHAGKASPGADLDVDTLRFSAEANKVGNDVQVYGENGKTVIRIDRKALFQPESSTLLPDMRRYLRNLADRLRESRDGIDIRGYANRHESIDSPFWPGNTWEISARRARIVHDFFKDHGIPVRRMSARGYGDLHPVYETGTGRGAPDPEEMDARVEIILGPNPTVPALPDDKRPGKTSFWRFPW